MHFLVSSLINCLREHEKKREKITLREVFLKKMRKSSLLLV